MPTADPGQGYTWFTARVRSDLYERFINRFPIRGSNVWWLNKMMEHFMNQVEKDPSFEEKMRSALNEAVET